jgi:hypothetical protein
MEEKLVLLESRLGDFAERYKQALLQLYPDIPGELIAGTTAEEIEDAMARARALVERLKRGVEAELSKGHVPAGAPPRQAPDLGRLSAREKIALGLERL